MSGYAEGIATWYFRLNGYLTTTNFVLHPEMGAVQLTDVDVVGVRFPWRREIAGDELVDDVWVRSLGEVTSVVLAEVKTGRCRLNGPTRDPDRRNLQKVIRSLGAFPPDKVDAVAASLYSCGAWEDGTQRVSLCCLGAKLHPQLSTDFPECKQLTWPDVASFIHGRFTRHMDTKKQHKQWDDLGQCLWNWATTLNASDFRHKLVEAL